MKKFEVRVHGRPLVIEQDDDGKFLIPEHFRGRGSSLKPACEEWILVRKPCAATVAQNVMEYGTGALNIDATRLGPRDRLEYGLANAKRTHGTVYGCPTPSADFDATKGRWPANTVLSHSEDCIVVHRHETRAIPKQAFSFKGGSGTPDHEVVFDGEDIICADGCPVKILDDQSGHLVSKWGKQIEQSSDTHRGSTYSAFGQGFVASRVERFKGDVGGASRFFYCAKPDRSERDLGCHHLPKKSGGELTGRKEGSAGLQNPRAGAGRTSGGHNLHPCVHPTTRVMTELGYKKIKDINPGDLVFGANGRFNEVVDISSHPYTSPFLYRVYVCGTNGAVSATDNHPFLIWRPIHRQRAIVGGVLQWIPAEHLQIGDYTLTPICSEPVELDPLDRQSSDFWFVVGLYAADGCISGGGYPSFSLHQDHEHLVDHLKRYNPHIGIYPKPESAGIQVVVFDRQLGGHCLSLVGRRAHQKTFSPVVWKLSRKNRRSLVAGYLAGDGGPVRTWQQSKSVSEPMASQLIFLAESVGYTSAIYRYPAEGGRIGDREFQKTRPYFLSRFSNQNRSLSQKPGGRKPSRPTLIEYEGVVCSLRRVKKIKKIEYAGNPVINLTVKDSPTFQTLVGVTHNTVKPLRLMRWLCRLVTPPGGLVLDPFTGSGTTGIAANAEGFRFLGMEQSAEYAAIARARLTYALQHPDKVPKP